MSLYRIIHHSHSFTSLEIHHHIYFNVFFVGVAVMDLKFGTKKKRTCCKPVVRESFEVDNKDFGKRPKIKLFGSLLMLLARWAIPENVKTINHQKRRVSTALYQRINHSIIKNAFFTIIQLH